MMAGEPTVERLYGLCLICRLLVSLAKAAFGSLVLGVMIVVLWIARFFHGLWHAIARALHNRR